MIDCIPLAALRFVAGEKLYRTLALKHIFDVSYGLTKVLSEGSEDGEALCRIGYRSFMLRFREAFLFPLVDFTEHDFLGVVFVADFFKEADEFGAKL